MKAVTSYRTPKRNSSNPIWYFRGLRWGIETSRRLIRNNAEAMTPFAGQSMHQPPGIFVSKARSFAPTVTDYGPFFHSEFACHRVKKCGQGRPRSKASLTFEFGFPFFQKRFHPFVLVFTREAKRKQIDFAAQSLVHI